MTDYSYQPSFTQEGGGGFGTQANFGGGFSSSQASPNASGGARRKERDPQTLTPCTVKQIMESEHRDNKFKIDGRELHQITILGTILSIEVSPTNVTYLIDDGTGKANVRMYVDLEDSGAKQNFQEGQYVRVIGNLRAFNDQKNVVGFRLVPVTDMNEVTYHFLQVIRAHLGNSRGASGAKAPGAMGGMGAAPAGASSSASAPSAAGDFGGFSAGNSGNNFSNIQNQVLRIFNQSNSSDQGISIDSVCQALPSIARGEIQRAIEFLSDEGHLYSTVDEQHFKSTSAD